MTSINTRNNMIDHSQTLNKTSSQISSGKRINSATDDAAGLTITSRFSSQISAIQQAQRNGLEAKSLIETEQGALAEIATGMQRLQELAIQQGNGILNDADRDILKLEAGQIKQQINQIIEQSAFNDKPLFQQSSSSRELIFQLGDKATEVISLAPNTTAEPIQQGLKQLDFSTQAAEVNLTELESLQQVVNVRRSELGAINNNIDISIERLSNEEKNSQGARSRIEDADIAKLVSQMVIERIKQQAQLALQSQANASTEDTLRLLS